MSKPIDQELLPCPFCGKSDALVERLDNSSSMVICQAMLDEYSACMARGPVGIQDDDGEEQPGYAAAVREWNARAAVQPSGVAVPEAEWVMHLLADRWPESAERVEVELFAEWLREVLAAAPHPVSGEQTAEEDVSDIASMVAMLEAGEWAEHAGKTPLGQRTESAITELVNASNTANDLADMLETAHRFIESTEAFGTPAASGILQCKEAEWNVDESKALIAAHRAHRAHRSQAQGGAK